MNTKPIYLDNAAATPLDLRVKEAMLPYLDDQFANPSSLYAAAREARLAIDNARAKVANILGAKKAEIIWTAGGTESINLAVQGVMRKYPDGHMVTLAIEHEAVLQTAAVFNHTVVPVKASGIVEPNEITRAITDQTVLVSVMYANNEIGTIQPIADIGKLIAGVRGDRKKRGIDTPIYLHTDACQAAGALDLHVSRLGVDMMTLNGSKMYGPKQTGILYVRAGIQLEPLIYGGGQERGLRSGTENVAGIVGFATALELAEAEKGAEGKRLAQLRDSLIAGLQKTIPELILNGHAKHRLPNNINVTIPGIDGETAVLYLDNAGISASTGSACTTGGTEPSHVLLAIGRRAQESTASLRFTLGRHTTAADIAHVIEVLPHIAARLRDLKATR